MKNKAQTKNNENNERFLLYIPAELLEELRRDAAKNYRTVSGQVSFILQQYYDQQAAKTDNKNA